MEAKPYAQVLADNLRAVRALRDLDQEDVAKRMRALGFREWRYQTVGQAEKGKRRLTAEEVMNLAYALDTSIYVLMKPPDDLGEVLLRSGDRISARSVALSVLAYSDRSVTWDGEDPVFTQGEDDITAQVVIRPRSLFTSSPFGSPAADPAFGDPEGRAPMP